jgi:hypothetical protein
MKMQKTSRTAIMTMGFAAVLLLAGTTVYAQSKADTSTVATTTTAATVTQNAVDPITDNTVAAEEDVAAAGFTPEVGLLTLILFAGMASIFLYAKMATRRERNPHPALRRYTSTSGATTH